MVWFHFAEKHADEARARPAVVPSIARHGEADQEGHEEQRVSDHRDEEPRADDEAARAGKCVRDGGERTFPPLLRLPGLGEAVREHVEQITLLRDAEVPAVRGREEREPGLRVTEGKTALRRRVGHGERLLRVCPSS